MMKKSMKDHHLSNSAILFTWPVFFFYRRHICILKLYNHNYLLLLFMYFRLPFSLRILLSMMFLSMIFNNLIKKKIYKEKQGNGY